MALEFRKFQQTDYPEYAAWFADPDLNNRLGPMDQEWLAAVLAEPEATGVTWAVLHNGVLVAVVETVFDPEGRLRAFISAIAVKPTLRRQGIGTTVLQSVLTMHRTKGVHEHIAYVAQDNASARRLLERVGFVLASGEPDEHGYLAFRYTTTDSESNGLSTRSPRTVETANSKNQFICSYSMPA